MIILAAICNGNQFDTNMMDEFDIILVLGYIQLIFPFFNLIGSIFNAKEGKHVWGSNIPGFVSITSGCLILAFHYKSKYNCLDYRKLKLFLQGKN
jgi:hypothetical protein